MSVREWRKVGGPEEIFSKYGKRFVSQDFQNPWTGEIKDFILFAPKGAPAIVLPITDMKVVAIRTFRYGANKIMLELPGGNPREKESPEDCVRRELMEETGYEPGKLIRLPSVWPDPASVTIQFHLFLALDCCKVDEQRLDVAEGEYAEIVLVPWGEWSQMVMNGTINDGKSIFTTHLALRYISNISKM